MGKPVSFDLLKKLRETCKGCTEGTLKTYERAIRRLAKIAGLDSVPDNKGWLSGDKGKALRNKVERLPLTSSRHLFMAGSQGYRMYTKGERSAPWVIAMNEASHRYSAHRAKQQKSPTEKQNWPKSGYKILGKVASTMKRRVADLLKQQEYNHAEQYEVQKYILLLLLSHHSFRTEPATWLLEPSETGNTLLRPRGSRRWVVTNRDHKTKRAMGTLKITLNASISKALSNYIPKIKKKQKYFLSTKTGARMSPSAMSKLVLRTTKHVTGKKIGVRLGRVLKATANRDIIAAAEKLRTEMGHSAKTQRTYVRKD